MSDGKFRPLNPDGQDCPTEFLLFNFDIGSSKLKPAHERFLNQGILTILEANGEHKVGLVGRASRSGPDSLDLKLSRQRAEAVAALLTRAGIDRSRIQVDFIGKSNPFSMANESEEDRSVEIHLQISPTLIIELEDGWLVRRADVMVQTIREAFAPIAARAGRKLQIHLGRGIATGRGDLNLHFDTGGREMRPCAGILIFGNEGGGEIRVGAHESLRVCGDPTLSAKDPSDIDHGSQLDQVFENGEAEFARFVGNTCVHELAHIIAKIEHTTDPDNFMFSQDDKAWLANLPPDQRTRENMRRHWGGPKTFNVAQIMKMVCAMHTGFFPGGAKFKFTKP
jgi:outer membrane protein OmpA-like peptidoglycan-associated protein